MTLKNGFGKCSLFASSANGWTDQNMDSSFSRKKIHNMEKALFDWPIVLQYEVKAKYRLISRKFFGREVFSAERSLHQPKARRVCIRSTNQSNRFIFVRLLSYENRSNCLRPARRGPGKAKWESCLPKGQAGIQVFLSPDFVTYFSPS